MASDAWNVCRFCKQDATAGQLVQYSRRHYAHFRCYLERGRPLRHLQTWQVAQFPATLIQEFKLVEQVEQLLSNASDDRQRRLDFHLQEKSSV